MKRTKYRDIDGDKEEAESNSLHSLQQWHDYDDADYLRTNENNN